MNIDIEILSKILAYWIQQYYKRILHRSNGIYPWNASVVQPMEINKHDEPH